MSPYQSFVRIVSLTLVLAAPAIAQHPSVAGTNVVPDVRQFVRPTLASSLQLRFTSAELPLKYSQSVTPPRRVETLVYNRLRADSLGRVKQNRGLGAVIGGGLGLIIGGVYGYNQGDERVPFDQATGAALYGGVGALIGAILGATFAPRVP